jgi:hypothetical protein
MGPYTATRPAAPEGPASTALTRRNERLRNVGEALRLYEEFERALAQSERDGLAHVVSLSRKSAHALSTWTRRVSQLRDLKRASPIGIASHEPRRIIDAPVHSSFGCVASLLI